MKCPVCGAWSEVLNTRAAPNHTIKRRRQCANEHRFTTVEALETAIDKRSAQSAAAAAKLRAQLWARDRAIRADTRPATLVAADHNLTEARIRQIRAIKRKKGGDA